MRNLVKTLSLILALVMVLGLVACSCGGPETPADDTTTGSGDTTPTPDDGDTTPGGNAGDQTPSGDVTTTKPNGTTPPPLPDEVFPDGTTFTFAVRGKQDGTVNTWTNTDIVSTGTDGDTIDSAVYRRNEYMMETYNVEIKSFFAGDCGVKNFDDTDGNMYGFIMNNHITGDVQIDAILGNAYTTIGLAIQNVVVDLNLLDHTDFKNDWWNSNMADELKFGDKVYLMASSITTVDDKAVSVFLVNKPSYEELQLPDIYQVVLENNWDLATFYEYAAKGYSPDSDGERTTADTYGFIYWQDYVNVLITSSGYTIADIGEDGRPTMNITDTDFQTLWAKMIDLTNQEWAFARYDEVDRLNWAAGADPGDAMFAGGQALFYWATVAGAIALKETVSFEFAIIPVPMYDKTTQEDYISTPMVYGYSVLSIPNPNGDFDKLADTGLIIEALARKSEEVLTPAFYEIVLKGKTANDMESTQMLDIVYDSIKYDVGNFMNFADSVSLIMDLFNNRTTDIMSWYASYSGEIEDAIDKVIALYE